jgi:hypothetical protein
MGSLAAVAFEFVHRVHGHLVSAHLSRRSRFRVHGGHRSSLIFPIAFWRSQKHSVRGECTRDRGIPERSEDMPRKPLCREEWCVPSSSQKATELHEQAPPTKGRRGLFNQRRAEGLPLSCCSRCARPRPRPTCTGSRLIGRTDTCRAQILLIPPCRQCSAPRTLVSGCGVLDACLRFVVFVGSVRSLTDRLNARVYVGFDDGSRSRSRFVWVQDRFAHPQRLTGRAYAPLEGNSAPFRCIATEPKCSITEGGIWSKLYIYRR